MASGKFQRPGAGIWRQLRLAVVNRTLHYSASDGPVAALQELALQAGVGEGGGFVAIASAYSQTEYDNFTVQAVSTASQTPLPSGRTINRALGIKAEATVAGATVAGATVAAAAVAPSSRCDTTPAAGMQPGGFQMGGVGMQGYGGGASGGFGQQFGGASGFQQPGFQGGFGAGGYRGGGFGAGGYQSGIYDPWRMW